MIVAWRLNQDQVKEALIYDVPRVDLKKKYFEFPITLLEGPLPVHDASSTGTFCGRSSN